MEGRDPKAGRSRKLGPGMQSEWGGGCQRGAGGLQKQSSGQGSEWVSGGSSLGQGQLPMACVLMRLQSRWTRGRPGSAIVTAPGELGGQEKKLIQHV